MKTLTFRTQIPHNRELRVVLPDDVPEGPAEVVVVVATADAAAEEKTPATFGDFLDPAFFGSWSDREDITDSVEFARELREREWRSGGDPPAADGGDGDAT